MSNPSTLRSSRKGPLILAIGLALLGPVIAGAVYAYGWWRAHSQGEGHWVAVNKGRAFLQQGRPDLAFAAVQSIRDDGPGAGEAMTVAGLALMQFDQPKYARMTLERALMLQPKQLDATKALAQLYLKYGNGLQGVALLQRAADLDPNDFEVRELMGRVYHDVGDPEKAAEAFDQALKLRPNEKELRISLIADLLNSNQPDRATPHVEAALKDSPDDARVLGLAAQHARDLGQAAKSKSLADQALERDPDNFTALQVRAQVKLGEGHAEEALADQEHAVKVNPNDLSALQRLALVENQLGLKERARQTMERHRKTLERATMLEQLTQDITMRPDDPEPRYQQGRLAAEGGLTVLAERCFRAALDLDPSYAPALQGLNELKSQASGSDTSAPGPLSAPEPVPAAPSNPLSTTSPQS
jgi:tetratricopeptide (TPR) repeat protein